MKRNISVLLLAAILAGILTACGQSTDTPDDQTSADYAGIDVPVLTEPLETSGVPADLDLNGQKINIWTTAKDVSPYTSIEGEDTGDKLDDAVYKMVLDVETKLNCDLVFTDTSTPQASVNTAVQNLLLSDDTSYDVFNVTEWTGAKLIAEGMFLNIADAPYIDIEKPWWDSATIEAMSIGDNKRFALVGDYSVDRVRFLNCMFYNRCVRGSQQQRSDRQG